MILVHIVRCDLSMCRFSACYRSTWELICFVASVELVAQLVIIRLVQHLFFPLFCRSLTVEFAHKCKLCRLLPLNVVKCLRCCEVKSFLNDHYDILFIAKLRHCYTNGDTDVLVKFGRISCPFILAGIYVSSTFICVMALSGS